MKFSLTYKQIEKSGFWPSDPGKGGTFDNWSDFSVGVNHMFYNTDSVFTSFSATYNGPASDYNPNRLITPGIESPEFVLSLNAAWVDQGLGLMAGADVGQALRYGRAYDQTRWRTYLNYFGMDLFSVGVYYGGVSTSGDDALDIGEGEWGNLGAKVDGGKLTPGEADADGKVEVPNDEGNVGGPFARLNEAFNYYGVSLSRGFGQYDVTLTYNAKLLDGAKNTDLNTGVSLAVGYSL